MATERAAAEARAKAERADEQDVVPWLRGLGFSTTEARNAAAACEDIPDAPLDQRVRVALSCFRARGKRVARPAASNDAQPLLAGATRVESLG